MRGGPDFNCRQVAQTNAPPYTFGSVDGYGTNPRGHAEIDIRRRVETKEVVIGFGHPVYTVADPRDEVIKQVARGLSTGAGKALARIGLANYFAGALVLSWSVSHRRRGTGLRYRSARPRFGVGLETVCHPLSTLQRPTALRVPFFFVCVDRAGNISKRQSATNFDFSRIGGPVRSGPSMLRSICRDASARRSPDAGRQGLSVDRPYGLPYLGRLHCAH
ncbi:short-chain fatty acyl-CoA regulator family protein